MKSIHKNIQAAAFELSEKLAALAKGRADNETISEWKIPADVLRGHSGTDQYWNVRSFFHALEFENIGWLGGAGAGHDSTVGEKEFRLSEFLHDIEIARQGMRTMLFLNIAEDLNVFTAEFLAPAQE